MAEKTYGSRRRKIAEKSGVVLWELFDKTSASWINLKLERRGRGLRKRNYRFGWNGGRVSGSRDAKLLMQYAPELFLWVVESLVQEVEG
jgi:hypothetical protein